MAKLNEISGKVSVVKAGYDKHLASRGVRANLDGRKVRQLAPKTYIHEFANDYMVYVRILTDRGNATDECVNIPVRFLEDV